MPGEGFDLYKRPHEPKELMVQPATHIFFSVIIPTYNRADCIAATIESVLQQTYRHFEVIVVDDGSTDNTAEIVAKYIGPQFFYYRTDHGERSQARNFGTSKSKGDYINWFDSDDIMLPHHLQELSKELTKRELPPIIGVGYEIEEPGKGIVYRQKFPAPILNSYLLRYNFMLTMTGIVRRDIALQYPFNTEAIPREDYELWMRIANEHPLMCDNKITVRVIAHEKSGSVISAKDATLYLRDLEHFIKVVDKNRDIQRLLNGQMRKFRMYRYASSAYYFAFNGSKRISIRLLAKSFVTHPAIVFRREFFATVKRILFTFRGN